jgi:hypothetical protein
VLNIYKIKFKKKYKIVSHEICDTESSAQMVVGTLGSDIKQKIHKQKCAMREKINTGV